MGHLRRRLLVELPGLDVVDEPFGLARRERLGADLPTAQVLGLHGIHDLDSLAAARRPDQVERSAAASRLDERGDRLAGRLGVRGARGLAEGDGLGDRHHIVFGAGLGRRLESFNHIDQSPYDEPLPVGGFFFFPRSFAVLAAALFACPAVSRGGLPWG